MTEHEDEKTTEIQPEAPEPEKRPRRFLRNRDDRVLAGVAGGLGRYFDIDPLIVRIVLVALAVFGGAGVALYAIGWLLIPEDGETESEADRLFRRQGTAGSVLLLVAAVLATWVSLLITFHGGFPFPALVLLALVGLGLVAFLIGMAIIGPVLLPFSFTDIPKPDQIVGAGRPPSLQHPMGETGGLQRDVLTLVVNGSRTSLLIGFSSMFIGVVIGTIVGAIAGLGRTENEPPPQ